MSRQEAERYEGPFKIVVDTVKPVRDNNRRKSYRDRWWVHGEPRQGMHVALAELPRHLVTPRVSKHRVFAWQAAFELPSDALVAIATDEDWRFGVLQSRIHEVWARATGTQLREAESGFRYTPTSCFETFPFPGPIDNPQRDSIAAAAHELDVLRGRWLNPPEWTTDEAIQFQADTDGPWATVVTTSVDGSGTAHYVRPVPKDEDAAKELKKRSLTALYNESPSWLIQANRTLDEAVFGAYGWSPNLSDDELLAKLLELNLARAAEQGAIENGPLLSADEDEGLG